MEGVAGPAWAVPPAVEFDEDAQCVQACIPVERRLIRDRAPGTPVGGKEAPGEGGACRADDRAERGGGGERRVAQREGGEGKVVGRIGDEGGGPVDQCPAFPLGKEVER